MCACSGVVWYNQVKLQALKQATGQRVEAINMGDEEKPLLQQR